MLALIKQLAPPQLPKTTIKEVQVVLGGIYTAEMGLATPKSSPQPPGQPQYFCLHGLE